MREVCGHLGLPRALGEKTHAIKSGMKDNRKLEVVESLQQICSALPWISCFEGKNKIKPYSIKHNIEQCLYVCY